MKTLLKIFLTYFVLIISLYSQTSLDNSDDYKTLSRLKLSGGYLFGSYSLVNKDMPFMNFNYRATYLDKNAETFDLAFAIEGGVNIVHELFPLYVKTGPEIKLAENFYMSGNFGILGIFLTPIPFYGFNGFYLIEISDNIFLEFETGIHAATMEPDKPTYYFNLGISLN